jgi:hypothetical protein
MKTVNDINYYIDMINDSQSKQICLYQANGTNYIKFVKGRETLFSGTKNECYYFVVGLSKMY